MPGLDELFPLGDGTADTGADLTCPYCAAASRIVVDPGGGAVQRYIEDCEVCCRPILLTVRWDGHGGVHVEARTEEDGFAR